MFLLIKAHSHLQVGNDNADRLANYFRNLGESSKPAAYLFDTEDSLLFQHDHVLLQGDPRDYLKKLEKAHMKDSGNQKPPSKLSGLSSTQLRF